MIPEYKMEWLVKLGFSTRQIAEMTGESKSNIQYTAKKYNLNNFWNFQQSPIYKFNIIDTPEKAYTLGFILCDGSIDKDNNVNITVAERDRCIVDFISLVINSNVNVRYKTDIEKRIFPKAITCKRINDITKFTGGRLKEDRHYPRVKEWLEPYLLLGAFDADGCITWGIRKDRKRLWHKISFSSQYGILYGIQQLLYNKLNISTTIKPKTGERCFVLEFSNRRDIITFLNFIYQEPYRVVLQRKYQKARALRLEMEENGEGRDRHE